MPTALEISSARPFFRATAYGAHDLSQARDALAQLARMVEGTDQGLLLDIREAASHFTLTDVQTFLDEFVRLRIGEGRKTAVLTSQDRYASSEFFAVSARSRGLDVQAFTSFEDTCDWLTL